MLKDRNPAGVGSNGALPKLSPMGVHSFPLRRKENPEQANIPFIQLKPELEELTEPKEGLELELYRSCVCQAKAQMALGCLLEPFC